MARQGMDAVLVRADAAQMDRIAEQLHALVGAINGSVGRMSTGWFGPDAEQLINRWQRQSRPALEALAVHVHRLAATARNEAHDQDVTSGVAGHSLDRAFGDLGSSVGVGRSYYTPGSASLSDVLGFEATLAGIGISLAQLRNLHLPTGQLNFKVLSSLGEAGKLARVARILTVAGIWTDTYNVVNDMMSGENPWKTGYDVAHLALSGAGLVFPPVGLGLAAWDAGTFIGQRIAEIPAVADQINNFGDGALDEGAKAVGGDTKNDPAAAARLVKRYEGVPGFFNAMSDGVKGWFK